MMGCAEVQAELTALADGALSAAEAAEVRRHLRSCVACARESSAIERAAEASRLFFTEPPELRPGFRTRMDARLADLQKPADSWFRRFLRPMLLGAATSIAILLMAQSVGGPSAVLVPLGLQAPPKRVAEKPALYKDYQIIEHLDELENFETVIQTPLEDEINGEQRGAG